MESAGHAALHDVGWANAPANQPLPWCCVRLSLHIMSSNTLALRTNPRNLNHHLYDNNGTWWIHFHVHHPDYTKSRIRESLGTKCLATARELRDLVLSHLALHARLGEPVRSMQEGRAA